MYCSHYTSPTLFTLMSHSSIITQSINYIYCLLHTSSTNNRKVLHSVNFATSIQSLNPELQMICVGFRHNNLELLGKSLFSGFLVFEATGEVRFSLLLLSLPADEGLRYTGAKQEVRAFVQKGCRRIYGRSVGSGKDRRTLLQLKVFKNENCRRR